MDLENYVCSKVTGLNHEGKKKKEEHFQTIEFLAHNVPEPLVTGTVFWGNDSSLGTV